MKKLPLLLLFLLFPLIDKNTYHVDLMTNVFIYALLAMGLNVVVGSAGLLTGRMRLREACSEPPEGFP